MSRYVGTHLPRTPRPPQVAPGLLLRVALRPLTGVLATALLSAVALWAAVGHLTANTNRDIGPSRPAHSAAPPGGSAAALAPAAAPSVSPPSPPRTRPTGGRSAPGRPSVPDMASTRPDPLSGSAPPSATPPWNPPASQVQPSAPAPQPAQRQQPPVQSPPTAAASQPPVATGQAAPAQQAQSQDGQNGGNGQGPGTDRCQGLIESLLAVLTGC